MINPAMMSVVRAFFFILFSPGRFAPRNRGALASCLCCLFFAVSLCGDRLNPCASLCSLLGGVSTECLRFFSPVQAPLKKPASRLALRMSWLYFVSVDDPPGLPVRFFLILKVLLFCFYTIKLLRFCQLCPTPWPVKLTGQRSAFLRFRDLSSALRPFEHHHSGNGQAGFLGDLHRERLLPDLVLFG